MFQLSAMQLPTDSLRLQHSHSQIKLSEPRLPCCNAAVPPQWAKPILVFLSFAGKADELSAWCPPLLLSPSTTLPCNPPIILRKGVFELSKSESVMIWRRAKKRRCQKQSGVHQTQCESGARSNKPSERAVINLGVTTRSLI